MKTTTRLATISVSLCCLLLFTGCFETFTGTVTPNHVLINHPEIMYDSSTPPQYDSQNGGLLWKNRDPKTKRVVSAVLTYNAVQRYNAYMDAYKLRFKNDHKIALSANDGIKPYVDQYKNNLFEVTAEHLVYFGWLSDYNTNRLPVDSGFSKVLNAVMPKSGAKLAPAK